MFLASTLDFQRASSTSLCRRTTSAVILKETQNVGFEGEGVFCFEPEFLISSFSKEKTQWQVPKWGGTNKQTKKKPVLSPPSQEKLQKCPASQAFQSVLFTQEASFLFHSCYCAPSFSSYLPFSS